MISSPAYRSHGHDMKIDLMHRAPKLGKFCMSTVNAGLVHHLNIETLGDTCIVSHSSTLTLHVCSRVCRKYMHVYMWSISISTPPNRLMKENVQV